MKPNQPRLEKHVVSLELAKQLKEAGYPQDPAALFYYHKMKESSDYHLTFIKQMFIAPIGKVPKPFDSVAAPLASEIGEQLPKGYWDQYSVNGGFEVGYSNGKHPDNAEYLNYYVIDKTEADARAKMWLYLKKEGLL